MATTIRDYPKLAADICDAVGKDNIISAPGAEGNPLRRSDPAHL